MSPLPEEETRRSVLLAVITAAFGTVPGNALQAAADDRPPNFVIIFADDLGYRDLGCFGSDLIRTPRIDRMAFQGMTFTSFYAQPICDPSRAAIMTGCYPVRVAERDNNKHPSRIARERGDASLSLGKSRTSA